MSRTAKFVIGVCVLILFLPPLAMAYYYGVQGYSAQDSFYSGFWMTDTAWAEGYSEKKFAKIKLGMNREEVRSIMGQPIWNRSPSTDYWGYSRSPSNTHYHQRGVVFSESGHVVEIVKGFYFD